MQQKILSSKKLKAEALRLGFSAVGVSPAEAVATWRADDVRRWLADGRNGEMEYLANNLEKRLDPRLLLDGAKTVVSVALNYFPGETLSPEGYRMARYAYGQDYHDVVRRKLRELMAALGLEEHRDGRVFCDTAPVDERYWAWRSGLGWQGRNCQFIVPGCGSYFFLGELLLVHPADEYDRPAYPHGGATPCGTCRRCIDACPAGALSDDGGIDARRCLSYLTIEHRGALPSDAARRMDGCIYGCDRCAEACPWNNFARPTGEADFAPSEALRSMTAADWQSLSEEDYRRLFKGSAVKRAKYEGLMRNIRAVGEENHP